jgi:hypothetical protein
LATHRQALAPASTGDLPAGQTQLPPFTVPPPQLMVGAAVVGNCGAVEVPVLWVGREPPVNPPTGLMPSQL